MRTPGRKPKPAHLKAVTGNPGKRATKKAPTPKQERCPRPPAHLKLGAKTECAFRSK